LKVAKSLEKTGGLASREACGHSDRTAFGQDSCGCSDRTTNQLEIRPFQQASLTEYMKLSS
jgi:hypothetical protein